jgi:hypothetical protein
MKKTIFSVFLLIGLFLASTTLQAQVKVKTNKRHSKKVHVKRNVHHHQNQGVVVKTNRHRVVINKPNRPHIIVKHPTRLRSGYVWVEGFWKWNSYFGRYIWQKARWKLNKRGHHWVVGYWEVTPGGFFWVEGCWATH